jgi:hypothetical protein
VVEWHRGSGGVGRGIAEMSKCDSNIPRISSTFRMRVWKDEAHGSTDRSLYVNMRKDAAIPYPHFCRPNIKKYLGITSNKLM